MLLGVTTRQIVYALERTKLVPVPEHVINFEDSIIGIPHDKSSDGCITCQFGIALAATRPKDPMGRVLLSQGSRLDSIIHENWHRRGIGSEWLTNKFTAATMQKIKRTKNPVRDVKAEECDCGSGGGCMSVKQALRFAGVDRRLSMMDEFPRVKHIIFLD